MNSLIIATSFHREKGTSLVLAESEALSPGPLADQCRLLLSRGYQAKGIDSLALEQPGYWVTQQGMA